jgi:hypothetical protein
MLAELEQQIVGRLASRMEAIGVTVAPFPASPAVLGYPVRRSQALVSLKRRRFERPDESDPVTRDFSQRVTIEFEIQVELVNLQTHSEAYAALDTILEALSGFVPAVKGAQPMYCTTDGFVDLDEAVYLYSGTYAVPLLYYSEVNAGAQVPPPVNWQELRIGLHRSRVDTLSDEVLDQQIVIPVQPQP